MYAISVLFIMLIKSCYCENCNQSFNNVVTVFANETTYVNSNFHMLTYANCIYKLEQTNDCPDVEPYSLEGDCKNILTKEVYIIYKKLTDSFCNVTYNVTFYNCNLDQGNSGYAVLLVIFIFCGFLTIIVPVGTFYSYSNVIAIQNSHDHATTEPTDDNPPQNFNNTQQTNGSDALDEMINLELMEVEKI